MVSPTLQGRMSHKGTTSEGTGSCNMLMHGPEIIAGSFNVRIHGPNKEQQEVRGPESVHLAIEGDPPIPCSSAKH